MIDLSSYDLVVFDGFGTLYDKDLLPLPGALELLEDMSCDSILFSNVGSITGDQLRIRLTSQFDDLPSTILTSMDLLIRYLNDLDVKSIYHFGGRMAGLELEKQGITLASLRDQPEIIVFTSLPGDDWIQLSQSVLRMINSQNLQKLILANPDRLLPGEHVGINVGMVFDMLVESWPKSTYDLPIVEIGKPNLNRCQLNIEDHKNVLVLGDNLITDGGLASRLDADFVLISCSEIDADFNGKDFKVYRSLEELLTHGK